MSEQRDVLIVGGGVIGLTAAYFLVREGVSVELVDKGNFGQEASWAGAGILPPGNPDRAASPIDQLRAHSAALYPEISAELRDRTGIDNGYLRSGGLEIGNDLDRTIVDEWEREGIAFESLNGQDLRGVEPALASNIWEAYFLPDMAQLRNPRHVKALLAWCQLNGSLLSPGCPVLRLELQGRRVVAVQTPNGRHFADRFILTAGAWTDSLLDQVGCRPGIHPVRGQIALLNTGPPVIRRILLEGKCYLVPRPDGRILVGATEEDAGFDARTTAEAIGNLLRLAIRLVPALAHAPLERCWAGLRPGSPDELPFIGAVPGMDNLFVAAGHFRAGIQLSPATGLVLKQLLLDQPLAVPLEAFRLDRTAAAPRRPAFRS